MQKIYPQDPLVSKFVEYYWILGREESHKASLGQIYDFPSLSNELVLDCDGTVSFKYKSVRHLLQPGMLFSYMDTGVSVDLSQVKDFTVVRFKSMGAAASIPFLRCLARDLVQTLFIQANDIFTKPIDAKLKTSLRKASISRKRDLLDHWLRQCLDINRVGLLDELYSEIQPFHDVGEIAKLSNLSVSSLERYFKKESGLTPKRFLLHNRFRLVLQDISRSEETDWHDLIDRYNYFDQTHLIKEVKRFSGLTPTELQRTFKLSTLRMAS